LKLIVGILNFDLYIFVLGQNKAEGFPEPILRLNQRDASADGTFVSGLRQLTLAVVESTCESMIFHIAS